MNIASYIDHTILKPDATREQVIKICEEAKEYKFASVCVNSYRTGLVKENLEGTDVKVCTVVGFPLGAVPKEVKVCETDLAIKHGAQEIDMVINIGALKDKDYDYVYEDIKSVVDACDKKAIVKVIIETCLLSDDEKVKACELSVKAGADFVKTSTGFSKGGATVEDVSLMKETVAGKAKVKASGGVRDYAKAKAVIDAGADRVGASAGIAIVEGSK
ncbi:deoxyribose-phosphate aldolase [Vallitalea longa]|uniref:Deoxyribose-phosphate aldolase n=1 Tax=Vallitalea longa TaxID=2936439 RepID=A0A9W6DD23_9FIRM|nr:deoxyribose-phosphate aldolase [Vallitalea longa]GKX28006.1 deoxyribose-phosphate aldolase [Vallitalea longa]